MNNEHEMSRRMNNEDEPCQNCMAGFCMDHLPRAVAEVECELRGWRDAALAYQDLNVCYRTGRLPPESLYLRLDKARIFREELARRKGDGK